MINSIDSSIEKIKFKIEILKHNYSRCENKKILHLIAIEQIKIKELELLKEEHLFKNMMLRKQVALQVIMNCTKLLIK